jgi:hypothetical protein
MVREKKSELHPQSNFEKKYGAYHAEVKSLLAMPYAQDSINERMRLFIACMRRDWLTNLYMDYIIDSLSNIGRYEIWVEVEFEVFVIDTKITKKYKAKHVKNPNIEFDTEKKAFEILDELQVMEDKWYINDRDEVRQILLRGTHSVY